MRFIRNIRNLCFWLMVSVLSLMSCSTTIRPKGPEEIALKVYTRIPDTPVYASLKNPRIKMGLPARKELLICATCLGDNPAGNRVKAFWFDEKEQNPADKHKFLGWVEQENLTTTPEKNYTHNAFALRGNMPVYANFEGPAIKQSLPFMYPLWTCQACASAQYDKPRVVVFRYDGNETEPVKQFIPVGWAERKDLLLRRSVIKNEAHKDLTVVLSNNPVHYDPNEKLDRVPVRFSPEVDARVEDELKIFDFYMVFAQTKDFYLIGRHRGIAQPLFARDNIIGWIPKRRAIVWETREAVQFIEDNRKEREPAKIYMTSQGLLEQNPWDVVAYEDVTVPVEHDSLRWLVIDKNEVDGYYEIYYLSGGQIKDTYLFEDWLRLLIRDNLEAQGLNDPIELAQMVSDRLLPMLDHRFELFRRGFVAAKQNNIPQVEEVVLVEREQIVNMISNYEKIMNVFSKASKNRVTECEDTLKSILRETLPDADDEAVEALMAEGLDVESINREMTGINFRGANGLLVLSCDQWPLMDPVDLESDNNRIRLSQDKLVKILTNQESLRSGEMRPHPQYPQRELFQIVENTMELEDPITGDYVEVDYHPRQFWWKRDNVSYGWIPFHVFP
ncbi:MAG: hypothetical protein HQM11_02725 [SAR324 cluster bacterium]|nr:hypothetical protein [SAR324 cluster bacterium]